MFTSAFDVKKFETLIEINSLINTHYSDPRTLLTHILESATRLTDGEASSLLVLNPDNNKLYFEIALGTKGSDVKKYSLNVGEGIAGWVAKNNTSLIVNDVDKDSRFFGEISKNIGFSTNSILAVPLRIKEKCIGVIELINKKNAQTFSQDDLQWAEIFANQAAIAIQNSRTFQKAREEIDFLNEQISIDKGFHSLIFKSKAIREKLDLVERISQTDSSVLLLGESGVGKELFAEQIHLSSKRRANPFIRVNCAALPEHLLESELFGHVKGAFTDATRDRRGRFELADTGTIFLDEIAEMPFRLQGKLLRILQQKTFEPVGSSETRSVDVRILAATNRDIEKEVEEGRFRSDLFYRLNVLPLFIPPLRERKEDIPELANFFLTKFRRETKKTVESISPEAMLILEDYSWPGNVRELENIVERAVVITKEKAIRREDLMLDLGPDKLDDRYNELNLKDAVNEFKRRFIKKVLVKCRGKQVETAKILGIQRTYLSRLMKELSITK